MTWRIGSLFSGYGGLDMAVQALLAGDLGLLGGDGAALRAQLDRALAWVCEHEPATPKTPNPPQAAARLLTHHHPCVPNLGDIAAVDWPSVERVDVLTGGFPCQDVSAAGKRAGLRPDSRSGLWAHFARAIHVLRPRLVVIENVRGLLSASAACDVEPCPFCLGDGPERPLRALGAVLGDLAVLGYDARWGVVHASDAGAPHPRARVFVFAEPAPDAGGGEPERRGAGRVLGGAPHPGTGEGSERERDGHAVVDRRPAAGRGDGADAVAGDSDGAARGERRLTVAGEAPCGWARADARGPGGALAPHTESERGPRSGGAREGQPGPPHGRRAGTAPDPSGVGRAEGRPEPAGQLGGPDAAGGGAPDQDWGAYEPAIRRWELILDRHAPSPTEPGTRGNDRLSAPFVEWMQGVPAGHVTGVPGLTRNDQLKLLGNGVCPQQAALAGRLLMGDDLARIFTTTDTRRTA